MGKLLLLISFLAIMSIGCDSPKKASQSEAKKAGSKEVNIHKVPDQAKIDSIKLEKMKKKQRDRN